MNDPPAKRSFGSQALFYTLVAATSLAGGVFGIWLSLLGAVAFGRWMDR